MNLLRSFISSSEPNNRSLQQGFVVLLWVAAWLVVLDVLANVIFAYPASPRNIAPGRLALYFDYGRSMEGRLRRGTRADPAETAPITLAGWYEPLTAVERPAKPGGSTISIYGMSHAVRLADALQRTSSRFNARSIGAPGATTNWAYGAYLRDADKNKSVAVVLAIMTSNLPMIRSMSPMTWNDSFAMPYTADRFLWKTTGLQRIRPPYESFDDYVATLENPRRWEDAKRTFAKFDPFYDPILFEATVLDHSTVARLIRRGWGQRRKREMRALTLDAKSDNESVTVANAIIQDFARRARQRAQIPVVYVINSRGSGDQMFRMLEETLHRDNIPYLSTHSLADPNDPRNYLPDNHFTDVNDDRFARALEEVIMLACANGHRTRCPE